MKFFPCNQSKDYIQFMKRHYSNDAYYIDFISPLVHEFIGGTSPFAKQLWTRAFLIEENTQIVGSVCFLIHSNASELLQVTFIEYLPGLNIAKSILDKAKEIATLKNAKNIVFGLNGHLNYGLGFSHKTNARPTFCSCYTKPYYASDFRALGLDEHTLTSYEFPWSQKSFPVSTHRIDARLKQYSFRSMTPATFKEDLKIYTALNNACFDTHPFYFKRDEAEDFYLFKDLKYFLSKNSLIFAEYGGQPVGFLLWYPNWSDIMRQGETLSAKTALKKLLFSNNVSSFKIVEWAVVSEHRKKGVPIGMLRHLYDIVKDKPYTHCKTSWIFDSNLDSNGFGKKWAAENEHYSVFSIKQVINV